MTEDKLQDTIIRDKELIERRLNQLSHEITRWVINNIDNKGVNDCVTQYKNLEQVLFTKLMME